MNKEDLNLAEIKGPDISADDVKFMRSVVERADRQIRPEGYVLTACGLICLTCYTAVHFLLKSDQQKWLLPVYLTLMVFLLGYAFFCTNTWGKASKERRPCSADAQAAY